MRNLRTEIASGSSATIGHLHAHTVTIRKIAKATRKVRKKVRYVSCTILATTTQS